MCRVFSYVVGRGCLLWPVRSLGKTLLALALLHSVFQAKFACYSRCFLTSYFCTIVPYNEKRHRFAVLVLKGLVGLQRTVQLQLLQHYSSGCRLGLLWYLMICLGTNRDHSVIFETAPKYCISDYLVNYEGYSISSKRFLPPVVDIMVIWSKLAHSSPF